MYIHCYGVCEGVYVKVETSVMHNNWMVVDSKIFCRVYFKEFQPKLLLTRSDFNLSDTPGGKGAQEGALLTQCVTSCLI